MSKNRTYVQMEYENEVGSVGEVTIIAENPEPMEFVTNTTNDDDLTTDNAMEETSGEFEDLFEENTTNCYCNEGRNFNVVELLCANCNLWFHESCIGYQLGKLVPFMLNYIFICKNCSPTGLENFKKCQALTAQMCVTAIGNLMQESIRKGKPQIYFSRDNDIAPFIELHWDSLTTATKKVSSGRSDTIMRTLVYEQNVFSMKEIDGEILFKLKFGPSRIKPNYEIMIKGGQLQVTEHGTQLATRSKRKTQLEDSATKTSNNKKGRSIGDQPVIKVLGHGYPLEHPFNKEGFRYVLAEPDPHAPGRREFDESYNSAGKLIPTWFYRAVCPNQVLLALNDRGQQLIISDDRLSVTGDKGYSMVRATHCVSSGNWYWEATIKEQPDNSACRIGWAQEFANLQAPLGFDKFGYSWRSRKGTVFHESRGKHYSDGYNVGDTLGIMICLPSDQVPLPPTYKKSSLIKFKNHLFYEYSQDIAGALRRLKPLIGSKIIYYKNGICFNESAVDIYEGAYFPAISLYKNCVLSVNFGPDFKHPPPQTDDFKFQGVCERVSETVAEQTVADLTFFVNNCFDEIKLNDTN